MKEKQYRRTPWRRFLEEEGICIYREENAPCDKGYDCMDCLSDEVFEKYKKYKIKNNLHT